MHSYNEDLRAKILEDALVNNNLIINDKIDEKVIELIVMQIFKINEEHDRLEGDKNFNRFLNPIKLYISSPGGNVIPSLSICSAIETSRTPVHTIALGEACSAAALILLCGHYRVAQKYSSIMLHEMSYGITGNFTEISERQAETKKLQSIYDNIIISKTKLTKAFLKDIYSKKQDYYCDSKLALKHGIIDSII